MHLETISLLTLLGNRTRQLIYKEEISELGIENQELRITNYECFCNVVIVKK